MHNPDALLFSSQVANILGISQNGVNYLADKGAIPCMKAENGTRLFRRKDVEDYAEQRKEKKRVEKPTDSSQ